MAPPRPSCKGDLEIAEARWPDALSTAARPARTELFAANRTSGLCFDPRFSDAQWNDKVKEHGLREDESVVDRAGTGKAHVPKRAS